MADSAWFNELYAKNYERLKGMAQRSLGSEAIAEEMVHEAFMVLLCKKEKLQHDNYTGFLVKTVSNLVKNELSRANTNREVPFNEELIPNAGETPLSLEDCLPGGLSEDERTILLLHFDLELSHKAIALRLGISEGSCRTRLYRAKEHTKKLLLKEKNSVTKSDSTQIYRQGGNSDV